MNEVLKFLTYVMNTFGYWPATTFLILSFVPLLSLVYVSFIKTSFGKVLDQKFSEKIEEEKAIHKEGNRLRKQFTKNVHEILDELAEQTEADRAVVFEFSNGTSNLVGLPFLFMSAAAEVVTHMATSVSTNYQRMNISIAASFLTSLEEEGLIYVKDITEIQTEFPVLTHFLKKDDVKSALFYILQGVDEPIGFIALSTTDASGKILNKDAAILETAKAAQKISTLINFNELTKRSDELKRKNKYKWWLW